MCSLVVHRCQYPTSVSNFRLGPICTLYIVIVSHSILWCMMWLVCRTHEYDPIFRSHGGVFVSRYGGVCEWFVIALWDFVSIYVAYTCCALALHDVECQPIHPPGNMHVSVFVCP